MRTELLLLLLLLVVVVVVVVVVTFLLLLPLLLVGTSNVALMHFYNDFSLCVRNFYSTELQYLKRKASRAGGHLERPGHRK
jgi:hypothetical protein